MANPGDVIDVPELGLRFELVHTASETGGEWTEAIVTGRPRGLLTLSHVHVGQTERHEVLDGSVRALRSLFSGQRATMTGPGVSLADASCLPGPAGRLPIWIGGTGRRKTLRLAGAVADGWNAPYVGAGTFRELNGVLDDWCSAAGRSPSDIERSVNLMYNLGSDDPATVAASLEKQWGDLAEVVRQGSLIGRPGDVLDQVAPYVEAGAQLVNVVIRPPWDQDLLDAYVTEVVPAMRREFATARP